MTNQKFLTKIHGLRGFSIILVLFFHFYEFIFRGGYLGVDIFFVISGYIVTKASTPYWPSNRHEISKFLRHFYKNRVARLLPVGLLVSTFTLLLASIFTSDVNLESLISFYQASLVGLSNNLLYLNQQDYFSLAQEFNFFTQTWSLGVEEQFYVVYSLLICLIPFVRNKFLSMLVVLSAISLFSNNIIPSASAEAKFYLIPFRFWEMGLGVLLYLKQDSLKAFFLKYKNVLNIYSILALIAAFFIKYSPNSFPFPILFFILPAVCFVLLTADEHTGGILESLLNNQILQFFGTISYSLYLIHWPVLVFTKYALGKGPVEMTISMGISVLLAYLITYFYEMPLNRLLRRQRKSIFVTLAVLVLVIVGSASLNNKNLFYIAADVDLAGMQWKENFKGCIETSEDIEKRIKTCFTPSRNQYKNVIFTVGDSHAGHLALMLQQFGAKNDYETKLIHSGDKANSIHSIKYDDWKDRPAVFEQIIKLGKENDLVVLTFATFHFDKVKEKHLNKAMKVWGHYIQSYLDKRLRVILVLDSPHYPIFPIESCLFDKKYGIRNRCEISREDYLSQRKKQENFFIDLKKAHPEIKIWDMIDEFCTKKCSVFEKEELVYFDYNHLSKSRSLKLEEGFSKFYEENF